MAKNIVFVATDDKTMRVGQRLYLDGWLANVSEPVEWRNWPDGEFERWLADREPIKILLWAGPPFTRTAAVGEVRDPQLIDEIYEWHLVNMEIWRAREEAYSQKHPNEYRGIKWDCPYVTNWGRSIEFRKTFAARVHWINVYNPDVQKTGINIEVLTYEAARQFVRISEAKRFISANWPGILAALVLVCVGIMVG